MSEDIEPTLSKLDVVLTFSIEVCLDVNVQFGSGCKALRVVTKTFFVSFNYMRLH
jgi:hypothetical protein